MVEDLPFAAAYAFLVVVACCRGGATYALGRVARRGGEHSARAQRWLDRPGVRRAQELVARWGAPVVTLSFLTIGVQSAVNASAGALRMPLRRYLPGLLAGALLWALVYATVGMAVVHSWLGGGWGWPLAALLAVALVGAGTWWWRGRGGRAGM
ncbi:VTT domain-containing protein [Nocardioides aequoreus]|uniref:VTT domain-containing protein n=1 Tax=Nocardioides aequoreus TaxID=397278 RepID=UPI0009FFC7F8|nr:VTT domain-containing protein [Nocardioides aequoreus]